MIEDGGKETAMKVSLSVGNYAVRPFYMEGLGYHVYCAEELCYCLKENAFLLDADLMNDKLLGWLGQDCGLGELADELSVMVHKKGSLSAFVIRILEYVGFYDLETMREVEQTLKRGAGLSMLEKRKLRIDQLLDLRKFAAAQAEYDGLLRLWEETSSQGGAAGADLKARLLHNKGVALAGLMRYGQAARAFYQAYETDGSLESLRCYLAAKRMELEDKEYVAFAAGLPEYTETALQLEKDVELLNRRWTREADYQRLSVRQKFLHEDERGYEEENVHLMKSLKDAYRSMSA